MRQAIISSNIKSWEPSNLPYLKVGQCQVRVVLETDARLVYPLLRKDIILKKRIRHKIQAWIENDYNIRNPF